MRYLFLFLLLGSTALAQVRVDEKVGGIVFNNDGETTVTLVANTKTLRIPPMGKRTFDTALGPVAVSYRYVDEGSTITATVKSVDAFCLLDADSGTSIGQTVEKAVRAEITKADRAEALIATIRSEIVRVALAQEAILTTRKRNELETSLKSAATRAAATIDSEKQP
jgi:hypothetical protein